MNKKQLHTSCKNCSSRGGSIFCELSEAELDKMASAKINNHYKAHQVIFYEGNAPHGLFCISSGKVKIYKMDANGNQQIVRLVGKGDVAGYCSLLAGETYSATAETIEESEICFIDKQTFLNTLEAHPATALNVMKSLAVDLRHAEEQMNSIAHRSLRERLAELLLVFQKKYGLKVEGGTCLDVQLSREELADMIGTTQESVIRLLSEFKKDKTIKVEGRKITLLNLPALADTANIPD